MNIRLYQYLADWNPMQFDDPTMGDAEVYEMMDAVHQIGEAEAVAQAFQQIFQFAFDETLPYAVCLDKATEAVNLQMECSIS
nr:DUF1871 family protein [Staphylococcus delphini]